MGTKSLPNSLCLHGLRSQNLLHASQGFRKFFPYSAKTKPFVDVLSGLFFLVLGGVCFCGSVFLREDISAICRQLVSSQIIIFAHSKINASRYACCLNFFARKCESAKTKPTAPFVALTGFCRVLLSPLFFPLSNHNMACKPLILLDFIRIYSLTYTVIRGIINI